VVHVPGFTALIYHGGLDALDFPENIPHSDECDSCGDCDQQETRYALRIRLLCRILN
jgi:hypothetical protein